MKKFLLLFMMLIGVGSMSLYSGNTVTSADSVTIGTVQSEIAKLCGFDFIVVKSLNIKDYNQSIPAGYRLPTADELKKFSEVDHNLQNKLFADKYINPVRFEILMVLSSESSIGSGQMSRLKKDVFLYQYPVYDAYVIKKGGYLRHRDVDYIRVPYPTVYKALNEGPSDAEMINLIVGIFVKD